jgi:hypothetical protein
VPEVEDVLHLVCQTPHGGGGALRTPPELNLRALSWETIGYNRPTLVNE